MTKPMKITSVDVSKYVDLSHIKQVKEVTDKMRYFGMTVYADDNGKTSEEDIKKFCGRIQILLDDNVVISQMTGVWSMNLAKLEERERNMLLFYMESDISHEDLKSKYGKSFWENKGI